MYVQCMYMGAHIRAYVNLLVRTASPRLSGLPSQCLIACREGGGHPVQKKNPVFLSLKEPKNSVRIHSFYRKNGFCESLFLPEKLGTDPEQEVSRLTAGLTSDKG